MPQSLRAEMEQRLGADLSAVRLHEDSPRASGSVRALSEGTEIHLAAGAAPPESAEGRKLLAHELAHVAQRQAAGGLEAAALGEGEGRALLEADAERAAEAAARGEAARVRFQAPAQLALRFDSWEHRALGDAGDRRIRLPGSGLVLSYGQVVALAGDFYREPDQLMKAPREEVERLLALIDRQKEQADANQRRRGGDPRHARPGEAEAAQNEKDFERATAWRKITAYDEHHRALGDAGAVRGVGTETYSKLAEGNEQHFAGRNLDRWRELHKQALGLARAAHQRGNSLSLEPDRAKLNEAYLLDAFGCHFLTDAFAAGHLVSGDQGRDWGEAYWDAHHGAVLVAVLSAARDDGFPGSFALLEEVTRLKARSIALKLVHDRLGEMGFTVRNAAGHQWVIYGDRGLARSPETVRLARQAVELSREEVETAVFGAPAQPRLKPTDLVPTLVSYADKGFVPIEELARDRKFFEYVLGWMLVDQTKSNPLYQLIKSNLGFAGVLAEPYVVGAGRAVNESMGRFGEQMIEQERNGRVPKL